MPRHFTVTRTVAISEPVTVPNDFFCGSWHTTANIDGTMCSHIRTHDSDAMVHKVFPAGRLNNPDWSLYDAYFAKVASQNFKGCLLTFGTTAIDAGTDPTYNWGAYTPGDESYYANLSVFRDVVVSPMVARAGGLVTDIEPVNENALHAPFSPLVQANTQQRIAHYAAARAGAKAVDPKINCLGLTQTNSGWRPGDTTYDFISGGGGAYLDDLAIHTYAGAGTVMANLIKLLNSLSGTDIGRLGGSPTRIYSTECGITSANGTQYIARLFAAAVIHAVLGFKRFYPYSFDDPTFGKKDATNSQVANVRNIIEGSGIQLFIQNGSVFPASPQIQLNSLVSGLDSATGVAIINGTEYAL